MSKRYSLKLPKRLADKIISHARAEAPNECCGILTSVDGIVSQVYPAINIDRSPVKYTIDQNDMARIFQEAGTEGEEVAAFYHSHTHTEAYPSPTDVKGATPSDWYDWQYVLVSLAEKDDPVIRSFRILTTGIEEVMVDMLP